MEEVYPRCGSKKDLMTPFVPGFLNKIRFCEVVNLPYSVHQIAFKKGELYKSGSPDRKRASQIETEAFKKSNANIE